MQRDIIHIDEGKCNGCGLCITGCHEGALALVDGKARLIAETYCDGLGACLPACPTGAITIVKKEADAFIAPAPGSPADLEEKAKQATEQPAFTGCPGTRSRVIERQDEPAVPSPGDETQSELGQWPVQIKLIPVTAPYLNGAKLLIAADCAAYSRANFHRDFIKGRVTMIGCPKLDAGDYSEKLTEIFKRNDIKSVTVVRMEVPCCGGLDYAVKNALAASGKMIPWQVVTLGTDGSILDD